MVTVLEQVWDIKDEHEHCGGDGDRQSILLRGG